MKIILKNKDQALALNSNDMSSGERFEFLFELISLSLKLMPDHRFKYPYKKYSCTLRRRI